LSSTKLENKRMEHIPPGWWGWAGGEEEVARTMYTHVRKCKNKEREREGGREGGRKEGRKGERKEERDLAF
jgi:hypothetical protein